MASHRAPSQEELKLLGELSAGSQLKEEEILGRTIDWSPFEKNNLIPKGTAALLSRLHPMKPIERANLIRNNPQLVQCLLVVAGTQCDAAYAQYYLTMIHQVIRNDTSIIDTMEAVLKAEIFSGFYSLIKRKTTDALTADKAGFILTSLLSRASSGTYQDEDVKLLLTTLVEGSCQMSLYGRLDCIKNILKLARYRDFVWNTSGAPQLITNNLDASKQQTVYTAVFCSWLLTFNKEFLIPIANAGVIEKICAILRESRTERVVRICIHTLLNCLPSELCVEALIQQNIVHTLTLLEYEKWRDEELYTEIRDGLAALQHKIKLFSNFDRYLRELDSGRLSWSFLHSEKFWHENVKHFEENEFSAVKKLVLLLRSPDAVTLGVACFDLGEFARLYPTGKKIIQKFKAKELVMMLMSHKDRDVSREALLCVQKMMLDNWKTVAGAQAQH